MQEAIVNQEVDNMIDPLEIKLVKKADRMLRNESARARRKQLKHIREMKLINEWAKARRDRKSK